MISYHLNHINTICKKAFLRCHQLLRTIYTTNPKIWGNLFKTYILPLLEYASPIWNSKNKELTKTIERVLRFYSRSALIKCKRKNLKYRDRLNLLNLEPLYIKRYYIDLVTLYKIIFNYTNLKPADLFTLNPRPSRQHDYLIQLTHKTEITSNSFINRTINLWNSLPKNIFVGHTDEI